ncbi:MAG: hypothetical protein AB1758_16705 [Candidatus Eremiobacterota bacterium]
MRKTRPGIAIPTTLFWVLVVYFICTVLAMNAQRNLRHSFNTAERVRRYYAARGVVNEFIANLQQNVAYENLHPRSNPVQATINGVEYRAWLEPDPRFPNVRHVVCESGDPGRFVRFSRSVNRVPGQSTAVFIESGPDLLVYTPEANRWDPVPDPPRTFYKWFDRLDSNGDPVLDAAGNPIRDMRTTTEPFDAGSFSRYGGSGSQLMVVYDPADPDGVDTLMTYAIGRGWSQELAPGDAASVGGGISGSDDAAFLNDGRDLYYSDRTQPNPTWSELPDPANVQGQPTAVTANRTGLYARYGNKLMRFDVPSQRWSEMELPPADVYTDDGELKPGRDTKVMPDGFALSRDGTLYGVWQRQGEVDTVFRYVPPGPDPKEPSGWYSEPPLRSLDSRRPLLKNLNSVNWGGSRLVRETTVGTEDRLYLGRQALPDPPGGDVRVITSGHYARPGVIDYKPGGSY